MRLIFTSFLFCIAASLTAQSVQQQKTDSVTRLIQGYYNKKDIPSLYSLAGETFKKALTEQALGQAIESLNTQIGTLDAYTLETFTNKVAKYKATFSRLTMTLYVSLDEEEKLETFLVREYEPVNPRKTGTIQTDNPLQSGLDKKTDSLVRLFMEKNNTTGMVVGVLENGNKKVYDYGEIVRDGKKLPDGNTLFEIGSLTKTFTATLLAWFVEQGKMKLDDPINKYLPDSIPKLEFNGQPITIQSLSNHSSGLPRLPADLFLNADGNNPYKHYDDKKLFAFLKQFKPVRAPGAQYEYSNLAAGLLGVILERVSGKPYEQLLKDIIWKPLKMENTRITLLKPDSVKFATGYDAQGTVVHSWEFQSLSAAGSIRSSVNDLFLYAGAQVAGTGSTLQNAIGLTHQKTFVKSGQATVALGWHFIPSGEKNYLWHNGQTAGYCSFLGFDEQNKRAIIILTNTAVDPTSVGVSLLNWLDKK